ncbi:MAG: DUF4238 domain-containing protein [Actinobacteria bacterium]|nr:DUF4238 domain-containing protein [Actinomycetota bacterium]
MFGISDLRVFDDCPLGRELASIAAGTKPWPESKARRHHYVPRFQLAKFTKDGENLFQLHTGTGQPRKTSPTDAAFKKDLYIYPDQDGGRVNVLEGIFATVENHAADSLRRLLADGEVSAGDRATISLFLALQWSRTPGALKRAERLASDVLSSQVAADLEDGRTFSKLRDRLKAEGDVATDAAAETLRRETIQKFRDGKLEVVDPTGGNTMGLLVEFAADTATLMFSAMEWTLVRSAEPAFVISDRGCAGFDPTPQHPWSSHAPFSSPNAETSFPLSANACLILRPGDPVIEAADADRDTVEGLNLRTYGWAEKLIYGSGQDLVVRIRKAAKRRPKLVVKPKPHRYVFLLERDPEDDRLARHHVAKGWDPYMIHQDPAGGLIQMDYMVVREDGTAVEVALKADELVRRRARKAAGLPPDSSIDPPGAMSNEVIEPGSILPTTRKAFRERGW